MTYANAKSPAYDLVPEGIAIPNLGETAGDGDPVAVVKWFTPDAGWTWYVVEFDPEQRIGFGLVSGFEKECGSFSLDEIQAIRGGLGLPVERDLYWKPTVLSKCWQLP